MKAGTIITVVLIWLLVSFSAFAQTPEPTAPLDIKYEAQILWGTLIATSVWSAQPITYTVVAGTPTLPHKFNGKIGTQRWEAVVSNNDPLSPKKVQFEFGISDVPSNKVWWYYRVRLGAYIEVDGVKSDVVWSDASDWVRLQEVGKPGTSVKVQ